MIASLVSLLDIPAPDRHAEMLPDFEAVYRGRTVWVTAVLERTVVVLVDGEKVLARKGDVSAVETVIRWHVPQPASRRPVLGGQGLKQARAQMAADQGAAGGFHRWSPAEVATRARSVGVCACGARLGQHNRNGVCMSCRRTCACGGRKEQKAQTCRTCAAKRKAAAS